MDPFETSSGAFVASRGRRRLAFAGCDYLGLAHDARVLTAARRALERCGLGASASRMTTGTFRAHVELERALAAWLGTEDAVATAAGYLASAVAVEALAPACDAIFFDGRVHPALASAARVSNLPVKVFRHFDADDLRRRLERSSARRPMILTDAIDLPACQWAPLAEFLALTRERRATLVLDDSHGIGVLGARGRGLVEEVKAGMRGLVIVGTLGKALGAHGGFVAGSRQVCASARAAAAYGGATPIPPAIAAAAAEAVRLASGGEGVKLRSKLWRNVERLTRAWIDAGLTPPANRVPWLVEAARPGESERSAERRLAALSKTLDTQGLLVPHVRYFGAPPGGFVRASVSACHASSHVERLTRALAKTPRVPRV